MVFIGALDSDLIRLWTVWCLVSSLCLCPYSTIITDNLHSPPQKRGRGRDRGQYEEEEEVGGGAAAGAAGAGDDGGAARTREGINDISRDKKSTSSTNTFSL